MAVFTVESRSMPPSWWHKNGAKSELFALDRAHRLLEIRGPVGSQNPVVRLVILRIKHSQMWNLNWEIRHNRREKVTGSTVASSDVLLSAFGIADIPPLRHSRWMLSKFPADAAEQGVFIRQNEHLNIPGPGTGRDGDPNASFRIDSSIQRAVEELLKL